MSTDRESLWKPGKLGGLWELINYKLGPLMAVQKALFEESVIMEDKIRLRDMMAAARETGAPEMKAQFANVKERVFKVVDSDIARLNGLLTLATRVCNTMLLQSGINRLERFNIFMSDRLFKPEGVLAEVNALRDAIEDDCKYKRLYLYPDDKSLLLIRVPGDWAPALKAFPSVAGDVNVAVDCYALGHNTAAVFHLMRVAEIGLRAIARERRVKLAKGKPLEWGQWSEILKGIENAQKALHLKPAGPRKDAALAFYSGSLGHLHAFKDEFRNEVSHVRREYQDWEAQKALNHVRDFMNGLASKLDETTTRQISWRA